MCPLQHMVHIQCHLFGSYIHSHNIAPDNLYCAFSITASEVEAWYCKHEPGQFLAYPSLFHQRQVQSTTTATHTTPTLTHTPIPPSANGPLMGCTRDKPSTFYPIHIHI